MRKRRGKKTLKSNVLRWMSQFCAQVFLVRDCWRDILLRYWYLIEPLSKLRNQSSEIYRFSTLESETDGIQRQLTGFYDRIHADGVQNVQWGSCSAPLTVTVFMIMSMGTLFPSVVTAAATVMFILITLESTRESRFLCNWNDVIDLCVDCGNTAP